MSPSTTGDAPVGRVIPNPPPPIPATERRVKDNAPYPLAIFRPTLADVREYVERLYRATQNDEFPERAHVAKMKKYLNFVGQSVDATGAFLHDMRRTESESDLFTVCDRHLLAAPPREFSPEPYPGIIARPNCETPAAGAAECSLERITA